MPLLRLAYATQFLIALIAVFVLWSQVGGQSHLDFMAWQLKLVLGGGAAFSVVKATAAAVSGERAWNGKTLRWLGILLVLLVGCGLASYYVHLYVEPDEDSQQNDSAMHQPEIPRPVLPLRRNAQIPTVGATMRRPSGPCLGPGRPCPGGPHRRSPVDG